MSINSAMLAGVSGLVANSSALAAISDNIANVNTVGYKRNQINFGNVVTSQAASGRYSAGGVQGSLHSYTSQQGLLQTTGSSTDIAISGDGFFVVTEKSVPLTPSDTRLFTRAGSFTIDPDGYLVNNSGFYLQGWPVQGDGSVDANPSDMNRMNSINIKNISAAVRPSTEIAMKANLNSAQTLSPTLGTYDPAAAATSMAGYAANPATGQKPDFTMQVSVIDSLGNTHNVAISFLKSATANMWNAEVYAVPASDISNGVGGVPGLMAEGQVRFTSDGKLDTNMANYPAGTALFANMAEPSIAIAGSNDPGATLEWAAGLGVAGQTINFDFGGSTDSIGALTQLADDSVLKGTSNNGAPVGEVAGVNIDEKGFISAVFTNGEVRQIAQVAIATFANPDGLQQVSGNAYSASIASGEFSLKKPSEGGAGDLAAASLEASTVDLSAEFTGLITTQRAYSASSKIILTADQMLEELINIKR
jgi:flagellar hook protein FlgE